MLQSTAQIYVVEDTNSQEYMSQPELPVIEVVDTPHGEEAHLEVGGEQQEGIEVVDPGVAPTITIIVDDIPGAPRGTSDPVIEVKEEDADKKSDENDASSKKSSWDWTSQEDKGFIIWVQDRLANVPKHSGYDTAGLERAVAYLEKLDSEISKAMRMDVDGKLDAEEVAHSRAQIENGVDLLRARIDKIKESKKSRKKKANISEQIVKEAQKITGVQGTYVTVPLLISGIGRVCINSVVSAGHDLNEVFKNQVKKYKLNDREQAELKFFLLDMGYTLRGDRGFMDDEEFDASSSDNDDFAANYQA